MVKGVSLAIVFALTVASLLQAESAVRGEEIIIPAGTALHCRISQTLTTKLNNQGDSFAASVSEPVMISSHLVIPAGATLEGRIVLLERPGRVRGVGTMRLSPERITFSDGRSFPMSATLMTAYGADNVKVQGSEGTLKGPSSRVPEMEEIGGGSAAGTVIGLIAHHPFVGMVLGGTAGFVDRVRRGGKDLNIPVGTQLNYQFTRPLISVAGPSTPASRCGPAAPAIKFQLLWRPRQVSDALPRC